LSGVLRVLYFASVRESVGLGEELLDPPPEIATVAALVDWLATTSPAHAAAFADRTRLRAAIDGRFAPLDAELGEPGEVALFPPVTGG
jgi:sulfur-carrier protein